MVEGESMKTKFEMMCEYYWNAYERAIRLKEVNFNFLKIFKKQFLEYLMIPEDELIFFPIEDNPESYYGDGGKNKINLHAFSISDDGFYNIGFAFKVYKNQYVFPNVILNFKLKFREENGVFKLNFGDIKKMFVVSPDVPEDFIKVFDHICFLVENYFAKENDNIKERGEPVKIGFVV